MQNPYVKYLKTKNGYFYLFYYEHGNIFCRSFSHDGWTVPQKIAEKASPVFSVCQYEAITYLLYSGGEGQLLPILPAGSTAPCEMAPPPPTVQGFSFCQARRPSILFTTCQQKQPAWIPLFTASFAMGNGKSPIRLTASCR